MAAFKFKLLFLLLALTPLAPRAEAQPNQVRALHDKRQLALAGPSSKSRRWQTQSRGAKPGLVQKAYPATHFARGQYFKQKGDLNTALIEFLKSTQENPALVKGFYEQALIFRERGYLKLAASSLEQALAASPSYKEARLLLATIQIQMGDVGGAMQELSRTLGLELNQAREQTAKSADPAPTVVLQSIHQALKQADSLATGDDKNNKDSSSVNPESTASKEMETPKRAMAALEHLPAKEKAIDTDPANPNANSDSLLRCFDLANIKESLEGALHASLTNSKRLLSLWHDNQTETEPEATPAQTKPQPEKKRRRLRIGKSKKKRRDREERRDIEAAGAKVEAMANSAPPIPGIEQIGPSMENSDTASSREQTGYQSTAVLEAGSEGQAKQMSAPSEIRRAAFTADLQGENNQLPAIAQKRIAAASRENTRARVKIDTDAWAKKLKNLAENGTNSLKDGEAFMFSEESGEASLFLADGSVIRRIVAQPRDAQEVVKERRPDILFGQDMLFNLSLLGKLMPHDQNAGNDRQSQLSVQARPQIELAQRRFEGDRPAADRKEQTGEQFQVRNMFGDSQGFWGWLKGIFKAE